jgi:hypothetical protein
VCVCIIPCGQTVADVLEDAAEEKECDELELITSSPLVKLCWRCLQVWQLRVWHSVGPLLQNLEVSG